MPAERELIEAALAAMKNAYAPYSRFKVGAALQTDRGKIFTGCNVENASYGLTLCAERVALVRAVAEGARRFRTLAVVSGGRKPVTPCGACLQMLSEFAPTLSILLVDGKKAPRRTRLGALLSRPFHLGSK